MQETHTPMASPTVMNLKHISLLCESGSEQWQLCDVESTLLTITSVQKSNEGSYQCVVAGSHASEPANLSIGKHPHLSGFI